jgi:hypothetical protein
MWLFSIIHSQVTIYQICSRKEGLSKFMDLHSMECLFESYINHRLLKHSYHPILFSDFYLWKHWLILNRDVLFLNCVKYEDLLLVDRILTKFIILYNINVFFFLLIFIQTNPLHQHITLLYINFMLKKMLIYMKLHLDGQWRRVFWLSLMSFVFILRTNFSFLLFLKHKCCYQLFYVLYTLMSRRLILIFSEIQNLIHLCMW